MLLCSVRTPFRRSWSKQIKFAGKRLSGIERIGCGRFLDVGGRAYLARQAEKNPNAFIALVGKVLPLNIAGTDGGPVMIITGVGRIGDETRSPPLIEHDPSAPALSTAAPSE